MRRFPPRVAALSAKATLSLNLLAACATVDQPTPVASDRGFLNEAAAVRFVGENVKAGDLEESALRVLRRRGFRCRTLAAHEYAKPNPETAKLVSCYAEADRTELGYRLVYANLGVSAQRRLTTATAGSYPVVYKNLRRDEHGRLIVVPDDGHREKN